MSYEYRPFPPVDQYHRSQAKIRICAAGARGGKTQAGIGGDLVSDVTFQPGYTYSDWSNRLPYNYLLCEPSWGQIETVSWPALLLALDAERIVKKDLSNRRILYKGQYGPSQIICASYEQGARRIEGLRIYRALLDEGFQCPEDFFTEVLVRLSDTNGRLSLIGTPKPQPYIIDMIRRADGKYVSFHTWKTVDNPHISHEAIEFHRRTMPPQVFKRNFEACLDAFEGQVFENFDRNVHVQDFDFEPERYRYVVGGQDWGYDHPGVLCVIGIQTNGIVDVLDTVSKQGIVVVSNDGATSWQSIGRDMMKKYGIVRVYADPARPEDIAAIRSQELPYIKAKNARMPGTVYLLSLFHHEAGMPPKIRIRNTPGNQKLIDCLVGLQWDDKSKEDVKKENDDEFDALRYAVYTAHKRGELGFEWFLDSSDGEEQDSGNN